MATPEGASSPRRPPAVSFAETPRRRRLHNWLRRFGWLVVGTTLLSTAAAAGVALQLPRNYAARALLVVQPGASSTSPGAPANAAGLADDYAGLIPEAQSIQYSVAGAASIPRASVPKDISIVVEAATSILQITFTAPTAAGALAGIRVIAADIAGPTPLPRVITPGTIVLVNRPSRAVPTSNPEKKAIPLGLLLGVAIGGMIGVAWSRSDPIIDDPDQLAAVVDCPVWDGGTLEGPLRATLCSRLSELAGQSSLDLGLLTVGEVAPEDGVRFAQLIEKGAPEIAVHVRIVPLIAPSKGSSSGSGSPTSLHDEDLGGRDLLLLAVASHTRQQVLERAVAVLSELGLVPSWAFLLPRRAARRGRMSHDLRSATGVPRPRPSDSAAPSKNEAVDCSPATELARSHQGLADHEQLA
jgi:hypothetical protein